MGFTLVGGDAQLGLDKSALERVLEHFSQQLQGASVALFYYAGHGLQVGGENYLVPTSANPARQSDVKLQMIDAQVTLDEMQDSGSRLNILILDACRNNPFGGRGLRAVGGGLAPMQAPEGTLIAYATQPGAVASDGKGSDSAYSLALGHVMVKRGMEFREAFNQVALAVSRETGGSQQPWTANSPIDGCFYFAGSPAAFPGPVAVVTLWTRASLAPVPTPVLEDAEILFWHSVVSSKDPRDFAAYLKQYPAGRFAALAQARLAEFGTSKPATSSAPEEDEIAIEKPERHSHLMHASAFRSRPSRAPERDEEQVASLESPVPRSLPNSQLSHSLTEYLHHHRLPYVDALVLDDKGAPSSVMLSGRVRTETGKQDAESKARNYLDDPEVSIRNQIILDSALASKSSRIGSPVRQVSSEDTGGTLAGPCCLLACEQAYSSCASACQAQTSAGSTVAQVGSVAASLLGSYAAPASLIAGYPGTGAATTGSGLVESRAQACVSRCAAQESSCSQECNPGSSRYPAAPN